MPSLALSAALTFALTLGVAHALHGQDRARRLWLLVVSITFYAALEPRYLWLIFASTLLDYVVGAQLARSGSVWARRGWLALSLGLNLGALGWFKLGDMAAGLVEAAAAALGAPMQLGRIDGALPVGISFYTFQTLSYTLDRYRGRVPPARSFLDFALYVSFFPQLVAGPIVRARDFLPQLLAAPRPSAQDLGAGLARMAVGIVKKIAVADMLTETVALPMTRGGAGPAGTLIGALGLYFAIYNDFSAYTDLAVGAGRALGLRLPENFARPALSPSPMEHWRRWHMTLNQLLADALYKPLAGGLGAPAWRAPLAGGLTFVAAGVWHGAGWSFLVMGLWNAVLYVGWRTLRPRAARHPLLRAVEVGLTLCLTALSLLFLRPGPLSTPLDLLAGLGRVDAGAAGLPEAQGWAWLGLAVALHLSPPAWKGRLIEGLGAAPAPALALALLGAVALALRFAPQASRFVYLQF
ncbi:MAG: MBOAT family protein [Deltaproteobacteria bacterium]|nr:MBOAT family protein [Deltaproteobacteria bacterium]